jgi:hypothetical protein
VLAAVGTRVLQVLPTAFFIVFTLKKSGFASNSIERTTLIGLIRLNYTGAVDPKTRPAQQ